MTSGGDRSILLIQIRRPDDVMSLHERQCISNRIGALKRPLTSWNAFESPVPSKMLAQCAGIIIGGSGDFSVHHPLSQRFVEPLLKTLDEIAALRRPLFGICFGHQLFGRWLGQAVVTDPERAELGTVEVVKTPSGMVTPVLKALPDRFLVHSGHSDVVDGCPTDCELILSNERASTQGFLHRSLPAMTCQFHPDMTANDAIERLNAYQEGFSERLSSTTPPAETMFLRGADDACELIDSFFRLYLDDARMS